MPLDFSEVTQPNEGADTPPSSDDPTCEVCGAPLTYSGRGRKPKFCDEHKKSGSANSATSSRGKARAADVERACETLDGLYFGIALGLLPLSQKALDQWTEQADALSKRNRVILANNKKLVDRINKGGDKGSTFAFYASHVVAITPVMLALRADIASRRTEGVPMGAVSDEDNVTHLDPDAAFRT